MTTPRSRRAIAALGGIALAGSLALIPTAAGAAPRAAEGDSGSCAITGGTLTWGLKESFRAYISGSIAHGSWDTSNGATYETPSFRWSGGTGEIDPSTGVGSVSFTGTVHFTGHDGILDLTLANPTIEFDDGDVSLLLDSKSNDMEGNVAVDEKQAWVGDVSLEDGMKVAGGKIELSKLPVKLTSEGAKAFAGFYEPDIDLDPIDLTLDVPDCADGAASSGGGSDEEKAPADSEDAATTPSASGEGTDSDSPQLVVQPAQRIPWLPIGIGGAALFVIGLTVGLLIGGRTRKKTAAVAPDAVGAAPDAESSSGPGDAAAPVAAPNGPVVPDTEEKH